MKQRNVTERSVPVNVSEEVQTDINLIHEPVYYDLSSTSPFSLFESRLLTNSGLIRPETDLDFFALFRQEIGMFRNSKVAGMTPEQLAKRLQWMETQIDGLVRRCLTIKNNEGLNDYHTLVSELQTKLDRQLATNTTFEPRLAQLNSRISELEQELGGLRSALIRLDTYKTENELYRAAFKQISEITKDPRRMKELEKTVNQQVLPLMKDYELKIQDLIRTSSVSGSRNADPKIRLRGQVTGLLRNFERLLRGTDELNLANVEVSVAGFLKELELSSMFDIYSSNKLIKHKYDDLMATMTSQAAVYRSHLETLIREQPSLKSQIDMKQFDKLTSQGVSVSNFGNVILLDDGLSLSGRTVYYQTQDRNTIRMLALISGKLKLLLQRFPNLKKQLGQQVFEFVTTHVFDEAMSLEEMQRLIQVVKVKPEVLKVENVYQYDDEKEKKVIFHLKVMIKALLDELFRLRDRNGLTLDIDEGLLGMIKGQLDGFIEIDDVLKVFRSLPKIVEVEKVVERQNTRYLGYLRDAEPITVEHAKMFDRVVEKPVALKEQVGVKVTVGQVEKEIHERPVEIKTEVIKEVPVRVEVLTEKHVIDEKMVEVQTEKQVPFYESKVQEIDRVEIRDRVVEVPVEVQTKVSVPVKQIIKQIVQVDRYEEKIVDRLKEITKIKEVKVIEQVPVEITKYIEVEKIINNFIKVPEVVEVKEQVPITITNTIQVPVDIVETVEKIVQTTTVEEKLVEVPIQTPTIFTRDVIKEIPRETIKTVKGDTEEVILEVEKIKEKPIYREIIVTKDVEIDKPVPLYVTVEKPIYVELKVPYIQSEPQIMTVEMEKFVPYREQVPVEIIKEIPVPIIQEKEVIKQVRVAMDRLVEKIVEVPRVVEVQKIVEKIVVVPRIVERIVEVPQIIEKIVERQVEVVKIVEIERPVPIYITNEVKEILREEVPKIVIQKEIQMAEIEKAVVTNIQREVMKTVEVERRIPVEVVIQKEVPTFTDRIVERVVTVRDIEIVDRQVPVYVNQQHPVEIIREKPVELNRTVEVIKQVPQIVEKRVVLYETKNVPEIHKITKQVVVQTIKTEVFTDVRNLIESKMQYKDMIKEVLVKEVEREEIVKPEPYIVQKIVVVNNTVESPVEIHSDKIVPVREQTLVPIQKPINHVFTKEVPRNVYVDRPVEVRTFVDQLREVKLEGKELVVEVEHTRPEVVQVKEQIIKFLEKEVEKRVFTEVPIHETNIEIVQAPGKEVLVKQVEQRRVRDNSEPIVVEKVVERVMMLPQVVEVMKNIHHVSGGSGLSLEAYGAISGVGVQTHTADYVKLCEQLNGSIGAILGNLRGGRNAAEYKILIQLLERLQPLLLKLIKFPTIIQVPHEVEKIVEKEKVITVPTRDQESINRCLAYAILIEKLIAELKRLKSLPGVKLQLEKDVLDIFFLEFKAPENMQEQLQKYMKVIIKQFGGLADWSDQHSLMLNSFLEERFVMAGILKESNQNAELLKLQLEKLQTDNAHLGEAITRLNIHNIGLRNGLQQIVSSVQSLPASTLDQKMKGFLEGLNVRGTALLNSDMRGDGLVESRITMMSGFDSERLRSQLRTLESEIGSFRGGQSERNLYLTKQIQELRAEIDILKSELKTSSSVVFERPTGSQSNKIQLMQAEIQMLIEQNNMMKRESDRKLSRIQQTYQKDLNEARRFASSFINSSKTTADSSKEQQYQSIISGLQSQLKSKQADCAALLNQNSQLMFEISKNKVEMSDLRLRQEAQQTMIENRVTTKPQQMDLQASRTISRQGQVQVGFEHTETKRGNLNESADISRFESPDVRQTIRFSTPADQQKVQHGSYTSQSQIQVRTSREFSESGGSSEVGGNRIGQQPTSSEGKSITLKELFSMEQVQQNENQIAQIIIKVIEKLQDQIQKGRYMSYAPQNIAILGWNGTSNSNIRVHLTAPINKQDEVNQVYLAPEILNNESATEKSCSFNIATIWDEWLNGSTFFKNSSQVTATGFDFKVRNPRLNPIYKNTIYELMFKDQKRRITLSDALKRISLHQFIKIDEQSKVTKGSGGGSLQSSLQGSRQI